MRLRRRIQNKFQNQKKEESLRAADYDLVVAREIKSYGW